MRSLIFRRIFLFLTGESDMKFRNLGIAGVLLAALGATACAATQTQRSTGEAVDDTVITSTIKASLVQDPTTKARQIEVETYRGVVQLSGFVDTAASKSRAEELAQKTKGVTRVDNNLEVRNTETTAGTTIDDALLTTRVKAALIDNPKTKARQINVETLRGVVQLSGFVDSSAEKEEAAAVAAAISGVKEVHNELAVKPAS
jgi:hyperosmotically inducible protein